MVGNDKPQRGEGNKVVFFHRQDACATDSCLRGNDAGFADNGSAATTGVEVRGQT